MQNYNIYIYNTYIFKIQASLLRVLNDELNKI